MVPLYTINIIVICKTYVAAEPICRAYCGVYPIATYFKAFNFLISLSEVQTKDKK